MVFPHFPKNLFAARWALLGFDSLISTLKCISDVSLGLGARRVCVWRCEVLVNLLGYLGLGEMTRTVKGYRYKVSHPGRKMRDQDGAPSFHIPSTTMVIRSASWL